MAGQLNCALCDYGAKPIKPGETCSLCKRTKPGDMGQTDIAETDRLEDEARMLIFVIIVLAATAFALGVSAGLLMHSLIRML